MNLLLNALKGQANTLNIFILLCICSYSFYKFRRTKAAKLFGFIALLFFLLTSTAYLPAYLVHRQESTYAHFDFSGYPLTSDTVFVHALGGGYTLAQNMGPSAQLSLFSLGRLSEAIRITRLLPNSILVVSGNISSGDQSQALVSKKTAIAMGVDSTRIIRLEDPATTQEEAQAFVKRCGTRHNVIVVTDAVHMPRAIRFFKAAGIDAHPAPTNYLIKKDDNPFAFGWLPSIENMLLMDRVFREFFGSIKGALMN